MELLLPMQQLRQRMFVMHVGRREHRAVHQAALAVHPDMQLRAEVPLLAFAGLVHLRVARLLLILRRARRADDRGVHDGAALQRHAAGLQHPADFGKQLLAQFVRLKQAGI
jgi:hypothetical protein